ncbi:MAG: hypothetical protein A3J76_04025 [Candidatus Moranbacteria bacterium RBG_13_45_13]|nr:MAG: hypothetical protein A3J76_04025 [Candidatus Moranbacteria bacterium RBG_13_45_13]
MEKTPDIMGEKLSENKSAIQCLEKAISAESAKRLGKNEEYIETLKSIASVVDSEIKLTNNQQVFLGEALVELERNVVGRQGIKTLLKINITLFINSCEKSK